MRRGVLILGGVVLAMASPVFAQAASSENYSATQQLNAGGGSSSSSQYQTFGIVDYAPTDITGTSAGGITTGSACLDCGQFEPPVEVEASDPDSAGGTPGITPPDDNTADAETPAGGREPETVLQAVTQAVAAAFTALASVLADLGKVVADVLETLGMTGSLNEALALATVVTTAALAALPAAAGLSAAVPVAQPLAYAFNFMFGWVKRRRGYGRVYDAASGKPIAGATVRLLAEGGSERFAAGKLLASTVTDANGSYHFTVDPGSYRLEVVANEYAFPSTATGLDYHGEHLTVAKGGTFHPDIPLDGRTVVAAARRQALIRVGRLIQLLRLPLMALGSASAFYFTSTRGAIIDYAVVAGYVLLWSLEYISWRRVRGEAKVVAASKPVDSAIVRLYSGSGELMNTVVTQPNGQFAMFAPAGEYRLVTSKEGHVRSERSVKLPYATQIFGTIRLQSV